MAFDPNTLQGAFNWSQGQSGIPLTYDQAQAQLKILQQFDPNAKLVQGSGTTGVGSGMGKMNPDGTYDYSSYTVDYDPSKLPKAAAGTTALGNNLVNFDPTDKTFGSTSMFGGHQWLKDPSKVFNDPTYGWVTPASNYGTEYTGTSADRTGDMIGKGILAATLAVMGGGLGQALGGGFGGQLGSGAFKFGANELFSGGKTDPLSSIIGMFSGGGGGLQALLKLFQGQGG